MYRQCDTAGATLNRMGIHASPPLALYVNECFFYLTRTYFPTAPSRQPVSFHHAGRTTLVLETAWWLDVPSSSHSAACLVGKLFSLCNTANSTFDAPLFSLFHPFCRSHWPGIISDNDIKSPQARRKVIQGPCQSATQRDRTSEEAETRSPTAGYRPCVCLTSRLQGRKLF